MILLDYAHKYYVSHRYKYLPDNSVSKCEKNNI
jgi:hypothetical protein